MFKVLVLVSFAAFALGAVVPEGMVPQLDGRIIGGIPTSISSCPYQVSIQRNGHHSCGGSILNSRTIVTAAHCLQSITAARLKIRAGSTYCNYGGSLVQVSSFTNHPRFNPDTMENDVAVIRLSSSLKFNGNIQAIDMASSEPTNGANAVVSGWGAERSGGSVQTHLQEVFVRIIGRHQCASSYYAYKSIIRTGMLCAAASGKDTCQGDSGGPLVSSGKQVGIVSWGNGCGNKAYPGVYTNVADYRAWILKNA